MTYVWHMQDTCEQRGKLWSLADRGLTSDHKWLADFCMPKIVGCWISMMIIAIPNCQGQKNGKWNRTGLNQNQDEDNGNGDILGMLS